MIRYGLHAWNDLRSCACTSTLVFLLHGVSVHACVCAFACYFIHDHILFDHFHRIISFGIRQSSCCEQCTLENLNNCVPQFPEGTVLVSTVHIWTALGNLNCRMRMLVAHYFLIQFYDHIFVQLLWQIFSFVWSFVGFIMQFPLVIAAYPIP